MSCESLSTKSPYINEFNFDLKSYQFPLSWHLKQWYTPFNGLIFNVYRLSLLPYVGLGQNGHSFNETPDDLIIKSTLLCCR